MARILVIDDEPLISRTVRRVLAVDHAVTIVDNGAEGLAAIVAGPPFDVILCDLMMPVMDGWQFVRECRECESTTPVIILSAARNIEQAARELGVQAVVPKPFNLDHLLDLVASHAA